MQLITVVFQITVMVLFTIVTRTDHLGNQCSHVSGVPCHHCYLSPLCLHLSSVWSRGLAYFGFNIMHSVFVKTCLCKCCTSSPLFIWIRLQLVSTCLQVPLAGTKDHTQCNNWRVYFKRWPSSVKHVATRNRLDPMLEWNQHLLVWKWGKECYYWGWFKQARTSVLEQQLLLILLYVGSYSVYSNSMAAEN